ncbi:MAG: substrate-binding domain-containing protein [Acidimicrobiales bacterium]
MPVPSDRLASVSIRDVASEAGVSHQTVSRVINESPSVKESTRQVVLDTIARLDFRPNRAARALAGGPVQSVTVLTSNTRQYGFAAALEGIEEATRAAGFALGVRVVESGTPADVRDAVERAIEPAGALIVIAYDRAGIAALKAVPPDVPVAAMVGTPSGDEAAGKPWVWIDDRKAARDATNYLLGLGHKTVHYVSIPSSSQRMLGWRSALEDAGVRVPKPLQAGWDPQSGSQAAQHQLASDPKVTAVLCGNDDLAIGVMRAIHQAGRAIPDDVSVVGFDDTPLAPFYYPALTTVRQDFAALGKACFAKLLSLLDANASQDALPWPQAELIVRESAGPPPLPRQRANGQSGSLRAGSGADGRNGGRLRRAPGTRSPAPAPAATSGVGREQTRKTAKGVSQST